MSDTLERKDWEDAKASSEQQIKQAEINLIIGNSLLTLANTKLSEFPKEEEEDPMPDAVKEIIDEVKK